MVSLQIIDVIIQQIKRSKNLIRKSVKLGLRLFRPLARLCLSMDFDAISERVIEVKVIRLAYENVVRC